MADECTHAKYSCVTYVSVERDGVKIPYAELEKEAAGNE